MFSYADYNWQKFGFATAFCLLLDRGQRDTQTTDDSSKIYTYINESSRLNECMQS